jgi:hypothetical protein
VRAVATLQLDDFETWPELTIRSVETNLRVSSEPLRPARLGGPSTLARGVLSAENATRGFEPAHCVQVETSMRSTQSLGTSASLSAAVVTPTIDGRPHPTPRVKSGPHKCEPTNHLLPGRSVAYPVNPLGWTMGSNARGAARRPAKGLVDGRSRYSELLGDGTDG